MENDPAFDQWMVRIRGGDAGAAAQLVSKYEKSIRVAVRVKLTDPRMKRHFDSMDVCQSVLASFFVRAAAGQYDLHDPAQLVALLVKMAQNKLLMQVRRHRTGARNVARNETPAENAPPIPDRGPGPARHAAGRELLETVLDRLDESVRQLAQRRAVGQDWKDIARDLGGSPQGHRMRLSRALAVVAADLGIDEDGIVEEDP